ncbi:MAG: DUF948 domain-containing protein [Thermodesulfobacteriota bacterium]
MTPSTFFLAVIAFSFVVLVAGLIPTLHQIRKTAKRVEGAIAHIDTEIEPLIKSATDTAEELQIMAASINDKIDQTDTLFNEVQEAGHVLLATTHILKDKISPSLIQIASINAGIKAFTKFFIK